MENGKQSVLIAVTGGIAAYKIPSVVSVLVSTDAYNVKVMMTQAAEKFITPLTLSALSKNPVYTEDMFYANDGHIHHIELADWADILVVAPATYNTISKIIQKFADNLVTSTVAAFTKKILIFPAMNTHMWENLLKTNKGDYSHQIQLEQFGTDRLMIIYEPAIGKMACGTEGPGKLSSTRTIVERIKKQLT
jgi:phosphopantothenoylcysteine decarboxylase/phosphopantothenate--cysteine ligase